MDDYSKEFQELHEHYSFEVDFGQQPLRIDKYLMNFVQNATRNKIQFAAKSGNILVVSHGNTIRAISVILGINSKEDVSSYEIRTGTYLLVE